MAADKTDSGGSIEELQGERDDQDLTPTDDGGAIARVGGEEQQREVEQKAEFYDNLVPELQRSQPATLSTLASRLIENIKRDKDARKKRDEEYAESIRRTGLGKEAPGGAEFDGASRAVHPILMESVVDFAAQAIKEILPSNGPVKIFIPGSNEDIDTERLKKADRKKNYMNWQFTTQMPEFRSELDQLLPQLGLSGSQYMRITPDMSKRRVRPVPQFLAVDEVSIPYSATSFYTAERQTYHEKITRHEFEERVASGMYHYEGQIVNPQLPEATKAEQASNKVEGKSESDYYNTDGLRIVHECSTWLDIGDTRIDVADGEEGDREELSEVGLVPYIVSIDESTQRILRIVRNWEESDENYERMQWIVEFQFVPWRGAYSIGLGQMIGSLAGSATGALRALLDSAHVNNIPSLLRLKGVNFSGQSKQIAATGITEVDGGSTAADDIRKVIMPVPFNEPSMVLYQLLGFCVDAAKGVVRTTFEDLSEDSQNLPVGTTLALIEQGMKVTSAIHLRLYHAMTYVIRILHRINRMYLTDEDVKDDTGIVLAHAADFDGPVDCVPTADPEIFSDVQRMAQWQIVMQRADVAPDLYNRREVEKRFLERTKIPDGEGLLVPEQKAEWMNPVNENAAMTLSRPVAAFPEQDHLAHLQVHLDYLLNPTLGQLPVIAPALVPAMMNHIREHVALWYVAAFFEMSKKAMVADGLGTDDGMALISKQRDPKVRQEFERLLAEESPEIMRRARAVLEQLPHITATGMQQAQQFNQPPQMPVDPNKQAETQRRAQETQLKLQRDKESEELNAQLELRKLSSKERQDQIKLATEARDRAAERLQRLVELQEQERSEDERTAAEINSRERINTQDNETALTISAAEIENDEKTARSTGHGEGKNPQPR